MKLLLGLSLLLSFSAYARTYNFSERFGVGGGGGWAFPIQGNDFDDMADSELMWNLHARYNLTAQDRLQLNYSMYEFENTPINARVLDLMYLNRINEGDRLTPFFGIGAGIADMGHIQPYHDNPKFAARVRLGFEYALTNDLLASIYADYQYIGKMPNNREDEKTKYQGLPGKEIFAIVPQVALTYFFGPDKELSESKVQPAAPEDTSKLDDDKDGIINSIDKCPGTEPGKTVNAYGCLPNEKASMTLEVLFPSGGSTLGDEANAPLDGLAEFLNEHPNTKLEVQGHTDNTGSKIRNKKLSEARANAVRTYLVEKAGISPTRVSAYGYGDEKPISDNTTLAGRTKNRRVIGVITQ